MNAPCFAHRPTILQICGLVIVALIVPAVGAARHPRIANTGGNNPPHAIIVPTPKIGVHPNVLAVPTLDGSQSFDPDFDFITYQWTDQSGTIIGSGPTVQVVIASPGTYTYVLTVTDTYTDSQGATKHHSASAATTVEVVIDLLPPVVDAPDITVSITDPGSATVSKSTPLSNYMLTGATTSAVDDVDQHPAFLKVVANNMTVTGSTVFPEGETPILVFYTDQAGNVGSSPATVHVVDRQDGDLFVQNGVGNCFSAPCVDVLQRIRGGAVDDICPLVGGPYGLQGMIVDSSGRLVSLRTASIMGSSGVALERCRVKGAPPETFAFFPLSGSVPPGYTQPLPGLIAKQANGITLARLREIVIDDNQNHGDPFVLNEDAYMFNLVTPGSSTRDNIQPVTYHVKQDFWEMGAPLGTTLSSVGVGGGAPSLYFHSGATYAAGGGCLDRIKNPLNIHAMGTLGGVNFNLQLNLFGSSGEICGWILDNVSGPHITVPPCAGPAPTDGSGFAIMDGFGSVVFDDNSGYGLTLFSNSGATGSDGVLSSFSELPFDDPGNPGNFFQNPLFGCAVETEVRYDAAIGPPKGGSFWGAVGVASTPNGFVGTSPFSGGGVVFPIQTGASSSNWIAQGIGFVVGITSWPPNVSAGAALSVLIRIDSPVDVLVTDPNGKKLGVMNGMPVNDFGNDGSDTGAGTHPRFYAINNPVPGDYSVQSVGTGTGPYTVHVYSVDTTKPFGQHIFSSGNAAPGALSSQNFTMGANGGITFTNHPPTANAGLDQTVNALANGTATINLDGSASSDPDGDPLTFTWAGPFGVVIGAQPQIIMPVGVNVLQLTVDDGKGGTGSANVTITVNPPADTMPPVVTPPAAINIPATEAAGARGSASAALAAFLAGATAVDNVDPNPSRLPPQVNGSTVDNTTLFPLGSTTVTFSFRDASGNTGSANSTVTVSVGVPRIAGAIINKGVSSGVRFYDIQFTNNGTGNARNLKVTQVLLRTLSGTGTVTYNTSLSPALPLNIGSLDAGATTKVRVYLNVPATVTRLSITENGAVQDVKGLAYQYSVAQATAP